MLQSIRKRLSAEQDGFTLIELMVVVLIIAILIAIAVPTFLGAASRSKDRAAQSDLTNAFIGAKTVYTDSQAFTTSNANLQAALATAEPSLVFVAGAVPAAGVTNTNVYVQVSATNNQGVLLERKSTSGTYYGQAAINGGTVQKCNSTDPAVANAWAITDTSSTCSNGW